MSKKEKEDHHSINNILGAVLLKAKTLPDEIYKDMQQNGRASIHRKAFIQSFRDCIEQVQEAPTEQKAPFEETKIILTDDHAEYDWIELLCGWIHGECPTGEDHQKDYYKIHKKNDDNLLYSAVSEDDQHGYASLLIKKLEAIEAIIEKRKIIMKN